MARKIEFTDKEKQAIEKRWAPYMSAVLLLAETKGLEGIIGMKIADDRSGFIVPDPITLPIPEVVTVSEDTSIEIEKPE